MMLDCCCGGVASCDSSTWPSTLYLTTLSTTVTLTADGFGNWLGTASFTESGKDGSCNPLTSITFRFIVQCVSSSIVVTVQESFTTCSTTCYLTNFTAASHNDATATASSYGNSPVSFSGTWNAFTGTPAGCTASTIFSGNSVTVSQ